MLNSNISINGYDILGKDGLEGIRYAWKYKKKKQLLESAAFFNHSKNSEDNISGYTTSVSLGCILRAFDLQCRFCRTGNLLQFSDVLSAFDIAKQNIFMVISDIYCSDSNNKNRSREFAYMGQGEPGYSYPQIRQAIRITNWVLKELGQKVHRHIISTVGIPEMIFALKDDIKNNFFNERITLHFSLHAVSNRERLMPIEKKYPFLNVLKCMEDFVDICGEKPCVGIILFNKFQHHYGNDNCYTNDLIEIKKILSYINPKKFRLSFCEFNGSNDICNSKEYEYKQAIEILNYARNSGYEAKLFSSFGKKENAACGLLGGKNAELVASNTLLNIEKEAESLIKESFSFWRNHNV